jgi:hypothetical protein
LGLWQQQGCCAFVFLLWVKGWACGSSKLLHLLRLVATRSFSTYLGLMQQQASTIIFYCGLKVCNIETWTCAQAFFLFV